MLTSSWLFRGTLGCLLGAATWLNAGQQAPEPAVPLDAIPAILEAFRTHNVVALGSAHGNQQADSFGLDLIRDPRFAGLVNDVLIELGNGRYQSVVDQFVNGIEEPVGFLRQSWLNTTQPQAAAFEMPAIFGVVRALNAKLSSERRLRLLLGDPPIDWDAIKSPGQLRARQADPAHDRDRYAADVVRREVLEKGRRVLAIYGAGHLFRHNVTHSIVSLLEASSTLCCSRRRSVAVFAQIVNAFFPSPSLALVRGTSLGATSFTAYFPPAAIAGLPQEWRVPVEDQFDAVLYVGPLSAMTSMRPIPPRCADPAYAERLRRLSLSPLTQKLVELLKRDCTPDVVQ